MTWLWQPIERHTRERSVSAVGDAETVADGIHRRITRHVETDPTVTTDEQNNEPISCPPKSTPKR